MKIVKAVLLAAGVATAAAPGLAEAHGRGGWGFGWGLGLGLVMSAPLYASAYYGPRYYAPYAYAPPVYVPPYAYSYPAPAYAEPPVYAQQPAPPVQQAQAPMWYFCPASNAYYPYVRECASGWQAVSPRPPGY